VLHALSDPTRRGIVGLLRSGPRTAGDLARAFPLAKSTLSAHFTVLRYAGLVSAERQGRSIVYRLDHAALEDVVATLNGWLDGAVGPPSLATPAAHAAQAGPAAHSHPRRHTEPERTRRRTAARALAVEGGLALLLARLALAAPGPAGAGAAPAVAAQQPSEPPAGARGATLSRRRGLGHLIRFGE
jgi:DNA-binding transcriptional ArsR family regulator